MARIYVLFLLLTIFSFALAKSPPSFCKCTCFTNSTIIPLDSSTTNIQSIVQTELSSELASKSSRASVGASGCSVCNRAFCLSYKLPICKGAEESDVFATCFQRDSRKDQIFVLLFIVSTLGLLGWAAVKSFLEKRTSSNNGVSDGDRIGSNGQYAPVSGNSRT